MAGPVQATLTGVPGERGDGGAAAEGRLTRAAAVGSMVGCVGERVAPARAAQAQCRHARSRVRLLSEVGSSEASDIASAFPTPVRSLRSLALNRFRLRRPSPALVVSIIALVVATTGTGYAALSLPKNSVGTK
jgi:hypothetical protein